MTRSPANTSLRFFFFMIQRPPKSTLFPTRRSSDLVASDPRTHQRHTITPDVAGDLRSRYVRRDGVTRSEEHTSELQSRPHLVCRLLLEKKKNAVGTSITARPSTPRWIT